MTMFAFSQKPALIGRQREAQGIALLPRNVCASPKSLVSYHLRNIRD